MERGQQDRPVGAEASARWPKAGRGRRPNSSAITLKAKAPRATTTLTPVEQRHLPTQIGDAGGALLRGRLVLRRRAADGGRDVGVAETKSVVERDRGRLVGQTGPEEGGEEPVTGAVAGEDPSGAVAAVGGRGQTDDQDPGRRVTETGDGTTPVDLVGEGGPPFVGHQFAPGHQPGTEPAGDDLGRERDQRGLALTTVRCVGRRPGVHGRQRTMTRRACPSPPGSRRRPSRPSRADADDGEEFSPDGPPDCTCRTPAGPRPRRRPDGSPRWPRPRWPSTPRPSNGRWRRPSPSPPSSGSGCGSTRVCSSATSATGRARASRSWPRSRNGGRSRSSPARSASPAGSRSWRCRTGWWRPSTGWPTATGAAPSWPSPTPIPSRRRWPPPPGCPSTSSSDWSSPPAR